jgi:hypothetical protein
VAPKAAARPAAGEPGAYRSGVSAATSPASSEPIHASMVSSGARPETLARPPSLMPARSATRRDAWLPTDACQTIRWTGSASNAKVAAARSAVSATPRPRAQGAVQYPTSPVPPSIRTIPLAPSSSPLAASNTPSGAPEPVAHAVGEISVVSCRACSGRYGDGTRVQRWISGSWQAR